MQVQPTHDYHETSWKHTRSRARTWARSRFRTCACVGATRRLGGRGASSDRMSLSKRERDPICDVCGHNHVQGVKCEICGHIGKYIVPGGPNRPHRGAIPPVPPGPIDQPNLTPPTIVGVSVNDFRQALSTFFELLPEAQASGATLPSELSNLDQLKASAHPAPPRRLARPPARPALSRRFSARRVRQVLHDALGDYHETDEQPSYVLAIPCRPVLQGLRALLPWPTPSTSMSQ